MIPTSVYLPQCAYMLTKCEPAMISYRYLEVGLMYMYMHLLITHLYEYTA